MIPMFMRGGGGGGQPAEGRAEFDDWFTSLEINQAFESVVEETDKWRKEVEEKKPGTMEKIVNTFRKSKVERYIVNESVSPRLYRIADRQEGIMSFEFTEVEQGGTSIKATYTGSRARRRIQTFKASMPAKLTSPGRGKFCSICGKPIQPDFKSCPYCGEEFG
jgi:hypothetical protein